MLRLLATRALVVLVLLTGGIWLGLNDHLPRFVGDALVTDSDRRVVDEALQTVQDRYYDRIPSSALADAAIAGAVDSLRDRFSRYLTPKQYKAFLDSQNSEFSGVGLVVSEHPSGLRIVEVYDGTPARRAGLLQGDVIVAVDGGPLAGTDKDAATDRIKGPTGTTVKLTVSRDRKRRDYTLTRARVSVPVVDSKMRNVDNRKLVSIRLVQFSSGAHAEVYAAIRRGLKKGAEGIVFDLRGNGGGLVSEAQLIASAFLADGKIVSTLGRAVPSQTLRATGDPVAPNTPLVVLVDRDTASASEIVAGAIQDRDRGTVVGERTFGKGVFQQVIVLSNGGALDITAGQYFTPKGRNLGGSGITQGRGIEPEVIVEDNRTTRADEPLRRALAVLRAKLR